jgi:hypothetical protein
MPVEENVDKTRVYKYVYVYIYIHLSTPPFFRVRMLGLSFKAKG